MIVLQRWVIFCKDPEAVNTLRFRPTAFQISRAAHVASETWKDAWTGRVYSFMNNLLAIDLNQAESVLMESSK
jgi:hypothetical protein